MDMAVWAVRFLAQTTLAIILSGLKVAWMVTVLLLASVVALALVPVWLLNAGIEWAVRASHRKPAAQVCFVPFHHFARVFHFTNLFPIVSAFSSGVRFQQPVFARASVFQV